MNVMHFIDYTNFNVRLQRYLQSNINNNITPIGFINSGAKNNLWIPDAAKVKIVRYVEHWQWLYRIPAWCDYLGLRKIYEKYQCSLIHAHDPWCAYYAYTLGLPVIFDDWEYWLKYPSFTAQKNSCQIPMSKPLSWLPQKQKQLRITKIVKTLLKYLPVVVTNNNLNTLYSESGTQPTISVPNVPLKLEREHAFATPATKDTTLTTGYVGSLKNDTWCLRDTRGIARLWQQRKDIGILHVFDGPNYCSHLDILHKLRSFRFNLLYWHPIPAHKFYLQNKAFLASVVGVPTIISSALTATISLLGEYALPVNSLNGIAQCIENYTPKNYQLNEKHLWEHYEPNLHHLYLEVCD